MKTNFKSENRNNAQESGLKATISIFIIVTVINVVNGQGYRFSADNNNENVVLTASERNFNKSPYFSKAARANAATVNFSEVEADNELKLEEWMTDEANFSTFNFMEAETEEPLELESWMTSDNYFSATELLETETEDALQLEEWMTSESFFNKSALFNTIETEEPLKLEGWMLDANNFQVTIENDEPLTIEKWMVADNFGGF